MLVDAVKPDGVAILAGIIPLKSAKMAGWLNANVPGIRVPEALLQEMQGVAGTDTHYSQGTMLREYGRTERLQGGRKRTSELEDDLLPFQLLDDLR